MKTPNCPFFAANNFVGGVARAGTNQTVAENQKCGTPVIKSDQPEKRSSKEFMCVPPVMARYVSVDVDPTLTPEAVMAISELIVWEYTSGECSATIVKEETGEEFWHLKVSLAGRLDQPDFITRNSDVSLELTTLAYTQVHGRILSTCALWVLASAVNLADQPNVPLDDTVNVFTFFVATQ